MLFSRIVMKEIFATLKFRDSGMIYLYISVNVRVITQNPKDFILFSLAKISEFTVLIYSMTPRLEVIENKAKNK